MLKHRILSRWIKRLFFVAILGACAGFAGWRWNQEPVEAAKFETKTIERGDVVQAVAANGQLNPVVKVEVGSQISGIILRLFADFNSNVKEGQLVAEIDPATFEANFIQAEGDLANAKSALELARVEARRSEDLFQNKLISRSECDRVLAQFHQAEAAVKISEGKLKKAQVDLERCKIHAPIDGIVISRDVNVGQTVAASLSAPKLFVIANDLAKMQIEAKVAEADIGRVQVGQEVKFTVDAFLGETFRGKVVQVRNAPIVDSTVVMYDTIIEVKNPELKLKPGMTANVSIIVKEREDVLKIPNAALRFHPPKDVQTVKVEPTEAPGQNKTNAPSQTEKKAEGSKSKKSKKKSSEKAVYTLQNGALHFVEVSLGISDGRDTEAVAGLKEGDEVVVSMSEPKKDDALMSRLLSVFKGKD